MAARSNAVARLIEAISPTLSAELERVVNETRETLEREFQKRLEAAIREAESVSLREAEARFKKLVADAEESVRRQVTDELERKFKQTLEENTGQLRKNFENAANEQRSKWDTERKRLQEQHDQWQSYAEAQRLLAEAPSQGEILRRFLKLAEVFAAGIAVYVTKPDGLELWKSRGKTVFPEIISQETTDPEFFFRPVVVRERTVAAVCAAQPYKADGLNFLIECIERAIEVFGMKLRTPTPKLPAVPAMAVMPLAPASPASSASSAASASSGMPAGDDPKAHSDARRAARLLISEIKLYHEKTLKEGRKQSDIYRRLQKEIDHGREMYHQQVAKTILSSRDYFHEELVRILSDNDPSRLGDAYPGPTTT